MNMVNKILFSVGLVGVLSLGGVITLSSANPVSAQTTKQEVCEAIGSGKDCTGNKGGNLSGVISTIVNVLSIIVGILAVIMIIIAGAKYITSGGDTNKITSAKNALVYAIIGLVIVALSQFMVRFVLAKSSDMANPAPKPITQSTPKDLQKKPI